MVTQILGLTVDPVDDIFLVVSNVLLFASAVLSLGFVILYQLLAKWRESAWGWNIILSTGALFLVLTLGVGAAFFGYDYPGRQVLRALIFLAVGGTMAHHIYLLLKVQLGWPKTTTKKNNTNKKEGSDVF